MLFWCAVFVSFLLITYGIKDLVPDNDLDQNLQVIIDDGIVQGISEKTETGFRFFSFTGIPFAQPPLGNLRFRAPQPPIKWSGVLDARVSSNCCAGMALREFLVFNLQYDGDEDCLYLNVYTPMLPKLNQSQPLKAVMVWFHGGGFVSGCSDKSSYGPEYLIVHDIVLVTVNYRLSFFGGLSTEDDECSGNWNIKDQIASLEWVQKNIARFGGDPTRVTIFGQSAGAASVNLLMMIPRAKNLFQAVIMQSGTALCSWAYQKHSRRTAFDVGYAAGIRTNNSNELLTRLRSLSSSQLKQAQLGPILLSTLEVTNNGLPFTPVAEHIKNGILTENRFEVLDKGRHYKVPVLMGTNSLEILIFDGLMKTVLTIKEIADITPSIFARDIESPEYRYKVGQKIRSFFVKSNSYAKSTPQEIYQLVNSDNYLRPISKTAALMAKHNPVYFYYFTYSGLLGAEAIKYLTGIKEKTVPGVSHIEEIIYMFKTNQTPTFDRLPSEDLMMIKKMTKLWTNFAKFRNPTPQTDPLLDNTIWPTVLANQPPFVKNYVEIGEKIVPHFENFAESEVLFWERVYKKYRKKPYDSF